MTREQLEKAYEKALNDAAKQLSYRDLSKANLIEKLIAKGHSEDAAEYAAAYLEDKKFLDDTRYAQMLLKSYARKGYGTRRIKQELKKRGISNDDADEVYSEYETDYSVLHSLLDKKLKGDISDKKEIQKAIAFLQRRGFSWSEIKKALDEYINEHIEY